ncbi:DNA repair protein [Paracoccidioides brasiliensis Pb03]|uniref:DNA repair protein RAD14 n=1 Tax=Paracoccidioides brasiliensis (strain Pb18) TaxID=502780 RepID=C1G984_PARBD|nr:DNA repair protein [Paracoccidioides brasiliensis Pb18]EEH18925.1 DNA repair protein [Paracoccidioides brasiliensis Pb03]EEH47736.1 DNA repair protein [Paracoccidioides brasiliensis Pb18]
MESQQRAVTPPPVNSASSKPKSPLTPEQLRKIEINRMKAKALREQHDSEVRTVSLSGGSVSAGQKRPYSAISPFKSPSSSRDARSNKPKERPLDEILPARNFTKYVEYDLSKMTDTKGGFLTVEDDPHNKALQTGEKDEKPAHMTLKEWERHQLLQSLRREKAGPFEPGLSVLDKEQKSCRECGSKEIDWKWEEILKCAVCNSCKEKFPEKYSLLTKTEAKEDYLLTGSELNDEELLPHLEKPNPHKATWNNMMLYVRFQVEEYAFSPKKWGSPEALDAEFERREATKRRQREAKFKTKLHDLKKRTRVEAYRRSRQAASGEGTGGHFGDDLGSSKHVHEWGRLVENPETGIGIKTCVGCGMEVEELEF